MPRPGSTGDWQSRDKDHRGLTSSHAIGSPPLSAAELPGPLTLLIRRVMAGVGSRASPLFFTSPSPRKSASRETCRPKLLAIVDAPGQSRAPRFWLTMTPTGMLSCPLLNRVVTS